MIRVYERWVTHFGPDTCRRCFEFHGRIFERWHGPQPPLHNRCHCERVFAYSIAEPDPEPPPAPPIQPPPLPAPQTPLPPGTLPILPILPPIIILPVEPPEPPEEENE